MTGLFGVVVALLTWDYVQIAPALGLDASWILGLNLAADAGLDHGTQFAFTYGPLGFLEQPMVVDGLQATLGAVYLFGLRAALASSLLWAARRSLAWPAAAALALVVAAIVPRTVGSVPLALTILWCLVALQREAPAWTARLLVYGGGALAAVEAMVKLNVGVTVLAMVVIAALALEGPRLRNLGRIAASFAIGFAVLWFAAGQGIGNLDDYVSTSVEVISGYQRGMQIENGAVDWDWAAALLVIGATLVAVLATSARERLAARIAIPVLVAVLSFSLLKYGFVRHDAGHVAAVFGVLAVVWLAPLWRGAGRAVAVGAIALIAIVYFPAADESLDTTFEPRLAVEQLGDLVVPGERHEATDSARAAMAAAYAVDPRILERIGDQPVDARPWEIGLAWAYGLNWDPLPVIQDYAAYTPELDQLNADALAAADGPRFILRHYGFGSPSVGAEGRYINFDSPQEARELFCRFGAVITSGQYQLLERSGADRCGPERPLETVEADYGEVLTVPRGRPGEAVFARIEGAGGEGIERLRTFAYREALRSITLGPTATRFQTATAPDGILLTARPDVDLPRPFALALNQPTIAIDSEGGFATSDGPLRIEFFALPIDPRRAGR